MKRLLKWLKRLVFILVSLIIMLGIGGYFYMKLPKFGQLPEGERLAKLEQSKHFSDGTFKNIMPTETLTEGYSTIGLLYDQFFNAPPNRRPSSPLPSMKTELKNLDPNKNVLVWFGHSSYFLQLNGTRFLVDPVFSGVASPIPGMVSAFAGTDRYQVEDLPSIDYLFITHDHYDHLDYQTIVKLNAKVKKVICGLGVGSHFERWGYSPDKITEMDWGDSITPNDNLSIHTETARHFSGRGFTRNKTLWASYIIDTPQKKIYVGGDSGYGAHFANIGEQYGPFDLAILENGQYNQAWESIHLLPEQTLKATVDLQAKRTFPVHSSKFILAMHRWDEPLKELTRYNEDYQIPLVTPMIGEMVLLDDETQAFKQWWTEVE